MKILRDGKEVFSSSFDLAAVDSPEGFLRTLQPEMPVGDYAIVLTAAESRMLARASIASTAGDTETLLGTTADGAAIALVHLARLAQGLAAAQSLAEMRAAAQPFTDLTAQLVADIDAGTVKLPHEAKGGAAAALAEIGARLTAVAAVFEQQSQEG